MSISNVYLQTYYFLLMFMTFGGHCIFAYFFFRSENLTVTKQIILDIDISEFFELNRFRNEENEDDKLHPDLKLHKLLMNGEIAEDVIVFCNNGGINNI